MHVCTPDPVKMNIWEKSERGGEKKNALGFDSSAAFSFDHSFADWHVDLV